MAQFRYKTILLSLALLTFVHTQTSAVTKHALVIGIGKYPIESGWKAINGDKDADSVVVMLKNAGFGDIVCLKNSNATKSNIVTQFRNIAERCQKGDIVYIHFSGHGQQVTDANGDENDKLDESWIPYDAMQSSCSADRGEKHLIDDEIAMFLERISRKVGDNGKILVVVDACHSGSSTREYEDNDTSVICRGSSNTFESTNKTKLPFSNGKWLLISACADNQSNYELRNPSMGKLTYAICHILRNGFNGNNKTFMNLIMRFFDKHTTNSTEQTPTLSGNKEELMIKDIFAR